MLPFPLPSLLLGLLLLLLLLLLVLPLALLLLPAPPPAAGFVSSGAAGLSCGASSAAAAVDEEAVAAAAAGTPDSSWRRMRMWRTCCKKPPRKEHTCGPHISLGSPSRHTRAPRPAGSDKWEFSCCVAVVSRKRCSAPCTTSSPLAPQDTSSSSVAATSTSTPLRPRPPSRGTSASPSSPPLTLSSSSLRLLPSAGGAKAAPVTFTAYIAAGVRRGHLPGRARHARRRSCSGSSGAFSERRCSALQGNAIDPRATPRRGARGPGHLRRGSSVAHSSRAGAALG
mmetsp:Transcript_13616/g.49502  ORF Transcript_13616/g.49502 Transcript_13616/m.49502 type:complete len:283 (-) Transcript_13616:23-871(-)